MTMFPSSLYVFKDIWILGNFTSHKKNLLKVNFKLKQFSEEMEDLFL